MYTMFTMLILYVFVSVVLFLCMVELWECVFIQISKHNIYIHTPTQYTYDKSNKSTHEALATRQRLRSSNTHKQAYSPESTYCCVCCYTRYELAYTNLATCDKKRFDMEIQLNEYQRTKQNDN